MLTTHGNNIFGVYKIEYAIDMNFNCFSFLSNVCSRNFFNSVGVHFHWTMPP